MKRIIVLTLAIVCLLGLCGCNSNNANSPAEHEAVSADYGKVIDLAKEEFAEVFKEFEDVQIEETTTMARTDDAQEIVVQFKYSSSNGDGLNSAVVPCSRYSQGSTGKYITRRLPFCGSRRIHFSRLL